MKLLLASGSPRRQSLLKSYGFDITVVKPVFDESSVTEKDPEKLVLALAEGKMSSVDTKGSLALAADTVVAVNGKILGKPETPDKANGMLRLLSGNTHTVYTGVCITFKGRKSLFCDKSDVTFHELPEDMIKKYIETGSPMDKAGAYGIQDEMGIAFVKSVEGEISNVIGLPMGRVITETERITK